MGEAKFWGKSQKLGVGDAVLKILGNFRKIVVKSAIKVDVLVFRKLFPEYPGDRPENRSLSVQEKILPRKHDIFLDFWGQGYLQIVFLGGHAPLKIPDMGHVPRFQVPKGQVYLFFSGRLTNLIVFTLFDAYF